MIRAGESRLNKGKQRKIKGGVLSLVLIGCTWGGTSLLLSVLSHEAKICLETILIFFCLAGTTLIKEVEKVFDALDISLEKGQRQVARIVGRDTTELSEQEVKKAALETLSENLSDGVIAPLFWLMLLGVPGMMAYKMINTLDSMIGYRTVRYKDFGCVAARIDDAANWLPARLTACLMLMAPSFFQLLFRSRKRPWPDAFAKCATSPMPTSAPTADGPKRPWRACSVVALAADTAIMASG